ncbi:hypothetical protein LTR65_011040 [Meristemomyces frigidus]
MNFDMLERELLAQGPASRAEKRMIDQLSDIMTMDEMFHMLLQHRLDAEPEYYDEIEQDRRACEAVSRAIEIAAAAALGVEAAPYQSQKVWGSDSNEEQPIKRKQTKAKAARNLHGACDAPGEGIQALALEEVDAEPEVIPDIHPILVKQDSLSVFHKMFPADGTCQSGSVRWSQLVQAITDAGFSATEAGGSAVSFSSAAGSIVFHKPHPDPAVDPVMVQSMGKRMRKWSNWSRDRFQVRPKDG